MDLKPLGMFGLAAMLACTPAKAADTPFEIRILSASEFAIIGLVDQIKIDGVKINRGNCDYGIELPGGGSDDPPSLFQKRPQKVKFGQHIKIRINPAKCDLIEIEVSTDQGVYPYSRPRNNGPAE
ncbi:MAG: hypothetical protein JO124_06555 [Hyphomicrobiales bacterium]|nr:hypothetical protein [Hyphomicrobiales bacterium]MBV9054888.1 hypothetical protein [Hyphomicrobiales bacterium]MBV9975599.1 hypothetical protein [Hyphomicrobiales bacterium]